MGSWGLKQWGGFVSSVFALSLMAACATSDFVTPEDEDVFFRYGVFCGAGNPPLQATTPGARLQELGAFRPSDAIDLACAFHDNCYEVREHDDPACDAAFISTLARAQFPDGLVGRQCENLNLEIQSAFLAKSRRSDLNRGEELLSTLPNAFLAGLVESTTQLGKRRDGFPDAPGQCQAANVAELSTWFGREVDRYDREASSPSGFTVQLRGMVMTLQRPDR